MTHDPKWACVSLMTQYTEGISNSFRRETTHKWGRGKEGGGGEGGLKGTPVHVTRSCSRSNICMISVTMMHKAENGYYFTTILYCTVLYCTVLYCTASFDLAVGESCVSI